MGNATASCCGNKSTHEIPAVPVHLLYKGDQTPSAASVIDGCRSSSQRELEAEDCGVTTQPGACTSDAAPSIPEPLATMVVSFEAPDGDMKLIQFSERPLGMKYSQSTPLTVTEVHSHSHAERRGVQVGWQLRKIGADDMAGKSVSEVLAVLRRTTNTLQLM
eukprot:CAMPEP_0194480588 /NCGR_PEP_ID=MMETSP0253-20130528/3341_1 /TAXON_ID=2966 /ORGANISM="Noctiluca scintillans" /LENGTH=161 /DNA_ID=CAMNT_0039319989 /DNA_START=39 /DNA_END=524 /DNA_ORIENTATION=+